MKKRTICLLLAMIMVLSIVLAGCSKTAETPAADETPATTEPAETTDNTETPEAPEETAEPALEQKTIQLMITGAGKQANSDKVWAAFNEQLQQYVPNTTVEFIDVSFDEYSEKFSQVLASGEGVDLAWTGWQQPDTWSPDPEQPGMPLYPRNSCCATCSALPRYPRSRCRLRALRSP